MTFGMAGTRHPLSLHTDKDRFHRLARMLHRSGTIMVSSIKHKVKVIFLDGKAYVFHFNGRQAIHIMDYYLMMNYYRRFIK